MRVRGRAIGTVLGSAAAIVFLIGGISFPDRSRIPGVIEPVNMKVIYARGDGFVRDFLPSGSVVKADSSILLDADNPELKKDLEVSKAELTALEKEREKARAKGEIAAAGYYDQAAAGKRLQVAYFQQRLTNLSLYAPIDGQWIAPQIEHVRGRYLTSQQPLGEVISDQKFIRAVAPQDLLPRLKEAWSGGQLGDVEIRLAGHPEMLFKGRISKVYPAGSQRLPSPALGTAMGGSIATDPKDQHGTKAAEEFCEVQIDSIHNADPKGGAPYLLSGQRVMVRMDLPAKPLAEQWWRSLMQLVQQKFQM
jgi:putative peptide zinc metalloprotease protein